MTEPLPPNSAAVARLHELAGLLRAGGRLPPETQQALAELLDHLGDALVSPEETPAATTELASSTTHLLHTLHDRPEAGPFAAAQQRLEQAARSAEAESPLVTGLVLRLIETLRNIGI